MVDAIFPAIPETVPAQAATAIGRSPVFTFDEDGRRGAFQLRDGALMECTGAAAVRQWFALMLRQQPNRVPIYRTDGADKIGIDRSVLGLHAPDGFSQAEIERNVRETASYCPAVRSVGGFRFSRVRRGLQCTFTAYLHDETTVEVTTEIDSE